MELSAVVYADCHVISWSIFTYLELQSATLLLWHHFALPSVCHRGEWMSHNNVNLWHEQTN